MKTILVVCTANICRSPMAVGLLRRNITELGLDDRVRVLSAGVRAYASASASSGAIAALAARDISLQEHRSQPISAGLLAEADIVLVMEEAHRESLFHLAAEHLSKIFLLAELVGEHGDVNDPYGGSAADYDLTLRRLDRLIERGLPVLLRRIGLAMPTRGESDR